MAIKVKFSQGQTEAKATALHQWDYGQVLEIESSELPTIVEVHFACRSMSEAVRHVCSANNGVAAVAIPNRCLEQAENITAWVYEIDGSTGTTIMTITIPVIARTRPSRDDEVPQEITDNYTELIGEVNEAVEALTAGSVTAAKAKVADYATNATSASNASTAATATSAAYATRAGTANTATNAVNDNNGDPIHTTYASFKDAFTAYTAGAILAGGTYQFRVLINGEYLHTILTIGSGNTSYAGLGWMLVDGQVVHYRIGVKGTSTVLYVETSAGATITPTIYYRRINTN